MYILAPQESLLAALFLVWSEIQFTNKNPHFIIN